MTAFDLGPCVWIRDHWFADMEAMGGQSERIYLVGSTPFEPEPRVDLAAEHVDGDPLVDARRDRVPRTYFAPRRLPELVRDLLDHGPPRGADRRRRLAAPAPIFH